MTKKANNLSIFFFYATSTYKFFYLYKSEEETNLLVNFTQHNEN